MWTKIVRAVAHSACPICENGSFQLEPGEDLDGTNPLVKCARCGHVARSEEFRRTVEHDEAKRLPPPKK
jgi:uncharacterized Zn finger protein